MNEINQSNRPMPFIVGTGRCGTTLLRLILDSHPQVAIPAETHFIPAVAQGAAGPSDPRRNFFDAVTESRNWSKFGLAASAYWQEVAVIEPFDTSQGLRAFYRTYARRFNKPRWGDKTPAYLLSMRLIERLLPEAHFVHVIRDGRDVALSVLPLLDRDGARHTLEEGAQWWVTRLTRGHQEAQGITHYLEIRYEDLVDHPARELARVCAFLELPWDDSLLRHHVGAADRLADEGVPPTPRALADRERVESPLDSDRVARWRNEMTADQRSAVEAIAGPLLEAYGYI